jgi:hypothetical protein
MQELPADKIERENEDHEQANRDRLAMYYYNTFCVDEEKKLVFIDILSELYYFSDELEGDEQVILYNAAKRIVKKMQLTDNVNVLMDAMISVSKYRRKE